MRRLGKVASVVAWTVMGASAFTGFISYDSLSDARSDLVNNPAYRSVKRLDHVTSQLYLVRDADYSDLEAFQETLLPVFGSIRDEEDRSNNLLLQFYKMPENKEPLDKLISRLDDFRDIYDRELKDERAKEKLYSQMLYASGALLLISLVAIPFTDNSWLSYLNM